MKDKLEKLYKRLQMAEEHAHSYIEHIAECEPTDRECWEDLLKSHQKEVEILRWVIRIIEG